MLLILEPGVGVACAGICDLQVGLARSQVADTATSEMHRPQNTSRPPCELPEPAPLSQPSACLSTERRTACFSSPRFFRHSSGKSRRAGASVGAAMATMRPHCVCSAHESRVLFARRRLGASTGTGVTRPGRGKLTVIAVTLCLVAAGSLPRTTLSGTVPPTTDTVTWSSNLAGRHDASVPGSTVTVSIAGDEPTRAPTNVVVQTVALLTEECWVQGVLSCSDGAPPTAGSCGSGAEMSTLWQCAAFLSGEQPEGNVQVSFDGLVDAAGNTGSAFSASIGTDGFSVFHDLTPPVVDSVAWDSDNFFAEYAAIGDIFTVSVTFSEPVEEPEIRLSGVLMPSTDLRGVGDVSCYDSPPMDGECDGSQRYMEWQMDHEMLSGEPADGELTVAVGRLIDRAGYSGAAFPAAETAITYDGTRPQVDTATWSADTPDAPTLVGPGSTVTIVLHMIEAITLPRVDIGSARADVEGPTIGWDFVATKTLSVGDSVEGSMVVTVSDFRDSVGNIGAAWAADVGTDGELVVWDETPPTLAELTWSTDTGGAELRAREELEVSLIFTESVSRPDVAVQGTAAVISSRGSSECTHRVGPCNLFRSFVATVILPVSEPAANVTVAVSGPHDEALNNFATRSTHAMIGGNMDNQVMQYLPQMKVISATFDKTEYRAGERATCTIRLDGNVRTATAYFDGVDRHSSVAFSGGLVTVTQVFTDGDRDGPLWLSLSVFDISNIRSRFEGSDWFTGPAPSYAWALPTLSVNASDPANTLMDRALVIDLLFDEPVARVSLDSFEFEFLHGSNSSYALELNVDEEELAAFIAEHGAGAVVPNTPWSRWKITLVVAAPLRSEDVSVRLPRQAAGLAPSNAESNTLVIAYRPPSVDISCGCCGQQVSDHQRFSVSCEVEFSTAVSGFDPSDVLLSAAGRDVAVESFVALDGGTTYQFEVDLGTVVAVNVTIEIPEGAPGVYPANTGPAVSYVEFVCVGTAVECSSDVLYFAGPVPTGGVRARLSEAASSALTPRWDLVEVYNSLSPSPVNTTSAFAVDEVSGELTNVEELKGGQYVFEVTLGGSESVFSVLSVIINVVEVVAESVARTVYKDEVLKISWRHTAPRGLYAEIGLYIWNETAAALGHNQPSYHHVDIMRLDSLEWTWRVPYTVPAGRVVVHLLVIGSPTATPPRANEVTVEVRVPVELTVGAWSDCKPNTESAKCGPGLERRSLSCRDVRSREPVPLYQCDKHLPMPVTKRSCDAGSCTRPTWVVGEYGDCPVTCGGSYQKRHVECRDASGAVDDAACVDAVDEHGVALNGPKPSRERLCNTHACTTYTWAPRQWSECTSLCGGSETEAVRYSDVVCAAEDSSQFVVDTMICAKWWLSYGGVDAMQNLFAESCDTLPQCNETYISVSEWGPCSHACDGGISYRHVDVCSVKPGVVVELNDTSADAVADCVADAVGSGYPLPELHRTCNTAPCPGRVYKYVAGEWSDCNEECGQFGQRTRSVTCVAIDGGKHVEVPMQHCADSIPGNIAVPESVSSCNRFDCVEPPFCEHEAPCSNRGKCEPEYSRCFCMEGYTGLRCELTDDCDSRSIVDGSGECCETAVIDVETHLCCRADESIEGARPVLDAHGRCCRSGVLDACGRCDGTAVAVDALGVCCDGAIDAAGLCCASGLVDACGICDGTSDCPTEAVLSVRLRAFVQGVSGAYSSGIIETLRSDVEEALHGILGPVASGGYMTVDTNLRNIDVQQSDRRLGETASFLPSDESNGGIGARSLQQRPNAEVVIVVRAQPRRVGLDAALFEIGQAPPFNVLPLDYLASVLGVKSLRRVATCGNGVCELGERCKSGEANARCCAADCVYDEVPCPTSFNSTRPCSGRGICASSTGDCSCFAEMGFAGHDCNRCAVGFERSDHFGLVYENDVGYYLYGEYFPPSSTYEVIAPFGVSCSIVLDDFKGEWIRNDTTIYVIHPPADAPRIYENTWYLIIMITATTGACFAMLCYYTCDLKRKRKTWPPEFVVGPDDLKIDDWPKDKGEFSEDRPQSLLVINPNLSQYERKAVRSAPRNLAARSRSMQTVQASLETVGINIKLENPVQFKPEQLYRDPDDVPKMGIVKVSPTSITLAWRPPEYTGGFRRVDHYIVAYKANDIDYKCHTEDDTTEFVIGGGGGIPASDPLLLGTDLQDIRVSAVNREGESLDALLIPFFKIATEPGPPTNLQVVSKTHRSFVLTWEAPVSETDSWGPLVGYEVSFTDDTGRRRIVKPRKLQTRLELGVGQGNPKVGPFADGSTIRRISVRAINATGPGPWAGRTDVKKGEKPGEILFVKLHKTAPTAPTNLRVGDITNHKFHIQWDQPKSMPIDSYRVTYTVSGQIWNVNTGGVETEFVIGGRGGWPVSSELPQGTKIHDVSVVAIGPSGISAPSNTVAQVKTLELPHAAKKPKVVSATGSSITIEWLPPRRVGGHGVTVQSYQLRYVISARQKSQEREVVLDTEDPLTSFTIGGGRGRPASLPLAAGTLVKEISVRPITRVGIGPQTEPQLTVRTQTEPGPPVSVRVLPFRKVGRGIDDEYLAVIPLTWQMPADLEIHTVSPALPEYYVVRYTVGERQIEVRTDPVSAEDTELTFDLGSGSGAPASDAFRISDVVSDIQVAAINGVGQGTWSEPPQTGYMPSLLDAPDGLEAADVRVGGDVELAWQAPPSDNFHPPAEVYILEYWFNEERFEICTDSAETHFTIGSGAGTPPAPKLRGADTIRDIRVRAVSSVGRSPWSAAIDSITAKDYSSPARQLRVLPYSDTQVPIAWSKPERPGGRPIVNWIVRYKVEDQHFEISTGSPALGFIIGSGQGTPASAPLVPGVPVTQITVQPVTKDVGRGAESSPIAIVTPHVIAGEPTTVSVSFDEMGLGTVPVSWAAPDAGFDGDLLGYVVRYTVEGVDGDRVFQVSTGSVETTFVIGSGKGDPSSDALPARSVVRDISVAANTTVGTSKFSVSLPPVVTLAPAGPARQVGIGHVSGTSVRVTWLNPAENGGSELRGYRIRWKTGSRDLRGKAGDKVAAEVAEGEHEVTTDVVLSSIVLGDPSYGTGELKPGTPISDLSVVAVTQAGPGLEHDPLPPLRTACVPLAPTDVSVELGDTELRGTLPLCWKPPADDGDRAITAYACRHVIDGVGEQTCLVTAATVASSDGCCRFLIGAGGGSPPSMRINPGGRVTQVSVTALNALGESARATLAVNLLPNAAPPPRPRAPAPIRIRQGSETSFVTVAWANPVKELVERRARESLMFTEDDAIQEYRISYKVTSGWTKALMALSLDREGVQIVAGRRTAALSEEAVRIAYEQRYQQCTSWPSWFDREFQLDEGAWTVASTTTSVLATGAAVESFSLELPVLTSFEFRIACKNAFGEWSDYSEPSRPVVIPTVPATRPRRPQVGEIERARTGPGTIASHDEVKDYIDRNMEADAELERRYQEWVSTMWSNLKRWASNQRKAVAEERKLKAAAGLSSVLDALRRAFAWMRTQAAAAPEWEKILKAAPAPIKRENIMRAAVDRARLRWVPIAKTAAAGRVDLLAMLPREPKRVAALARGRSKRTIAPLEPPSPGSRRGPLASPSTPSSYQRGSLSRMGSTATLQGSTRSLLSRTGSVRSRQGSTRQLLSDDGAQRGPGGGGGGGSAAHGPVRSDSRRGLLKAAQRGSRSKLKLSPKRSPSSHGAKWAGSSPLGSPKTTFPDVHKPPRGSPRYSGAADGDTEPLMPRLTPSSSGGFAEAK